jgi:uncharacterized protein
VKLHLAGAPGAHLFQSCGDGELVIDGVTHRSGVLVTRERLIAPWGPGRFEVLGADDLAVVLDLGCDILLLGTGPRQRFPTPALVRSLLAAGIGVEAMSTPAACRTYNILVAEDRKVAAAVCLS